MRWTLPPVTSDEHVEIGNRMKDCRRSLMLLLRRSEPYSPLHEQATKAIDALDRLRTQLDCHLHLTVAASRDPRHLLPAVYSGIEPLVWREYGADEMDRDDFASWASDR